MGARFRVQVENVLGELAPAHEAVLPVTRLLGENVSDTKVECRSYDFVVGILFESGRRSSGARARSV